MRALREASLGVSIAVVTTCTVLGGIFLAVSESNHVALFPAGAASPSPSATLRLTQSAPSATSTLAIMPTLSPTFTEAVTPTTTPSLPPTWTPTRESPSQTAPPRTGGSVTRPDTPSPTVTPCVPRANWVAYIVQPGDTLFRIGLRYGLTVNELKQANCLSSDAINYGERIFVPHIPSATPPAAPTAAPTFTPSPTAIPAPLRITNVLLVQVVRDVARAPNGAVAYIKVEFTGGMPPYTFYDEGTKQLDNPIQALTECNGTLVHTVRVESADGQSASQSYYFSPITCP